MSSLDDVCDELPRQQLAVATSPVMEELVGRIDDGLQRMSKAGNVESSELESLKSSYSITNAQSNVQHAHYT